jgi:prevent-host-death family protein
VRVRRASLDKHPGVVPVATGGYIPAMTTVSIKEAKNRLTELARKVENGETITITRNGKPVLDLVPHKKKGGLNWEAGEAYLRKIGVKELVTYVADDFDDPLPEDFLLQPLPEKSPRKR